MDEGTHSDEVIPLRAMCFAFQANCEVGIIGTSYHIVECSDTDVAHG